MKTENHIKIQEKPGKTLNGKTKEIKHFKGDEPGPFTCHSCKQKCPQIWALLEHVFTAHGFRLSDEHLPGFSYPSSGSESQQKAPRLMEAPRQTTTATTTMESSRQRPQKLLNAGEEQAKAGTQQAKSSDAAQPNAIASLLTPRSELEWGDILYSLLLLQKLADNWAPPSPPFR